MNKPSHIPGAKAFALALGLGFASVLSACAGSAVGTTTTTASNVLPPPNATGEYTPAWPQLGRGEARFITIQLGPDTYEYCRSVSPKFPFDNATTYVQYKDQLLAFASCLNHPSMMSRHVLLVGRADPRGTNEYNLALGERRAEEIKVQLVSAGISPERIEFVSAGKRDAKGQLPEYSFGYDRRVDVIVSGGAHQP